MKKSLLLLIAAFALQILAAATVVFAVEMPIVEYTIHVRLDTETKQLHASEVIRYTNRSTVAISDLQFHLYLNAFKNEKSTFARERGGKLHGIKDDWGWIDIQRLSVDGTDVIASLEYIQPDNHNSDDQTVARVPLKSPVLPGQTVTVEIEFEAQLPRVFVRTGYRKDYYFVAQWFPKLGVWEPIGRRGRTVAGWNCHQYHAATEFYADFGDYNVYITVPKNFIVGATGSEIERIQEEGQTTIHFEADRVIDFTWTASPDFLREERVFRMADWVTEEELQQVMRLHGISREEAVLPDLTMILLLQPEHREQADRHFRALSLAIKSFGLWYGPYPYPTITLVDPAWGARASGGMEYPRLIAGGTSRFAPKDDFKLFGPEEVIVHEFGHQYWQTLVASNEFEEAWLDEGVTTYSTGLIMDLAYGPSRLYLPIAPIPVPLDLWLSIDKLSERQLMRLGPIVDRGRDQIVREAWKYYDFMSYGVNSYPKAAAVLYQLQNEIGDDVMARVMRTYFQRWHFNHPGTQDFIAIAEEISGRDLDWFFDQLVFGTGYLDYDVTEARSVRIEAAGVFDTPEGRVTLTSRELKQKRKKDKENEEKQALYRSTVTITNHGIIQYPVEILVLFKDGEEVWEHWDGSYRWVRYEYERKSELDRVIIDPDERILIDLNQVNNSWIKDPELRADLRWILQCIFWIQNLFYGL